MVLVVQDMLNQKSRSWATVVLLNRASEFQRNNYTWATRTALRFVKMLSKGTKLQHDQVRACKRKTTRRLETQHVPLAAFDFDTSNLNPVPT